MSKFEGKKGLNILNNQLIKEIFSNRTFERRFPKIFGTQVLKFDNSSTPFKNSIKYISKN